MVIRAGRFEFDAGMMDLAQSFMTVRKVTAGGVITYQSDRARGSNHGDLGMGNYAGHLQRTDRRGSDRR